jgi:hypothetical protein
MYDFERKEWTQLNNDNGNCVIQLRNGAIVYGITFKHEEEAITFQVDEKTNMITSQVVSSQDIKIEIWNKIHKFAMNRKTLLLG